MPWPRRPTPHTGASTGTSGSLRNDPKNHADRPPLHAAADRHAKGDSPLFTSLLEPTHLIVVALVALVFLGPKRLPGAGRALGQGLREFKDSIAGAHEDL